MRALTVVPGQQGSAAVVDVPEPDAGQGDVLVDGLALGVCGTDREIVAAEYGTAPDGDPRLVLGHESLGVVREAPDGSDLAAGDLVVGIVRRPDPVPCPACARGEFDMCRNGRFRERGIKELHGYGSQRWRVEQDYCVRIDPTLRSVGMLMEPTTIVAKAVGRIERIATQTNFEVNRLLVTGAGSIGLLAAMLATQHGLDVHVLDRVTEGPKPKLVADLGATYHTGDIADVVGSTGADAILEATGAAQLVFDAMDHLVPGGIVCLTGVSPEGRMLTVDAGGINRDLVLQNNVVAGSVNANRGHYRMAAAALANADRSWLERVITRRVPLERFGEALESRAEDVKVVLELN